MLIKRIFIVTVKLESILFLKSHAYSAISICVEEILFNNKTVCKIFTMFKFDYKMRPDM